MHKQKTRIDENIKIFNYDNMKIWKYANRVCNRNVKPNKEKIYKSKKI